MDIQEINPTEECNFENISFREDSTMLNIGEKGQIIQKVRCNKYFSTSKRLIEKLRKRQSNKNLLTEQKEDEICQVQQIKSTSQEETNSNNALCSNCYELINQNLYDLHIKVCENTSQALKTLEDQSYADQIDFKIAKLINSLQNVNEKQIMQIALNILQIDSQDLSCNQIIKNAINKLQLLKTQASFLEQTFIARLIFLAREKMKEAFKYQNNKEEKYQKDIIELQQQLSALKRQVNKFNQKTQSLKRNYQRNNFKSKIPIKNLQYSSKNTIKLEKEQKPLEQSAVRKYSNIDIKQSSNIINEFRNCLSCNLSPSLSKPHQNY